MTDTTKPGAKPGSSWFAVDLARIMRLPERLRTLWPHELMPRPDAAGSTSVRDAAGAASVRGAAGATSARDAARTEAGEAASDEVPGAGKGITETLMLGEFSGKGSRRGFDVLTAWLTGFAAELNLTRSRITIVISSGGETAHLEVSLCEDLCLAILVLRGEGLGEFAGFELLRRLRPQDLAQVTEELCALIEKDCVFTLTYLNEAKVAGMEILHRVDGAWTRPTLERDGETITVGVEQDLESNAVRILLATILTRLRTTEAQQPPVTQQPPSPQRSSASQRSSTIGRRS